MAFESATERRYGLDGQSIVVYKFRLMTVTENGPQIINVIQDRMSLVGPRLHAVAHNEEYRKLIKGYMVRHKVLPGITGLAQVNGYRGETADLADMQARVDFDLEYLRRWSVSLDLHILFRTIMMVVKDEKAY